MNSKRCSVFVLTITCLAVSLLPGISAHAARIVSIDFRGGGCTMQGGTCNNAEVDFGYDIGLNVGAVSVFKDFSKIESDGHTDGGGCAGGHADGSSCSGQGGGGACSGQGGSGGQESAGGGSGESGGDSGSSGHTGSHESETLYDRLPPIHMFLTLENSGQADLYSFTEEVSNHTDQYWAGYLMALKQNESGLAMFQHDGISSSDFADVYPDKPQSKKLQWTGGKYLSDEDFPLTFAYDILFKDCVGDECIDAVSWTDGSGVHYGYQIMLQSFPLVPAPVPEPATVLLLGVGLISLTGFARSIRRS